MMNLERMFKNPFDNDKISDNELQKFSEDNLARITANNPGGILDPILADTGAKHIAYFGAISNEDVAAAVKEGMTISVDNQIEAFKALVRRREGAIRSTFGKESATYQEFLPQGLNEYNTSTKENVAVLMQRMVTALTTHERELGSPMLREFFNLQSTYQAMRAAQLGKKGQVGDLKEDTAATRTALELQLTANIHFIGFTWPGNVQQCMAYFDQSFLRDAERRSGGNTPVA